MAAPPVGAPYTPSGTFPDLDGSGGQGPLLLQLDGEVLSHDITFQSSSTNRGTLAKLIDAADWLKKNAAVAANLAKQTASSGDTLIGVLTYAGRFLTLPTGTLRGALVYIANNAITDGASVAITPSASAFTADYAVARNFHVLSPTAAVLTITLKSTSSTLPEGAEMTITAFSVSGGKNVIVAREDGTQPIIMTGSNGGGTNFGFCRCKVIGGVWRLMDATGLAANGGAPVPGSINNP